MARRASRSVSGAAAETPLDPSADALPFEQAVAELEALVDRIEQGEIGLEESLRQFKRGEALVRRCRAILDAAELQIREISQEERAGSARSDERDAGEGHDQDRHDEAPDSDDR